MSIARREGWWPATVVITSTPDRVGNAVRAHLANSSANFLLVDRDPNLDRDPTSTAIPVMLVVDGVEAAYTVSYALTDDLGIQTIVLELDFSLGSEDSGWTEAVFIDIGGDDQLVPQSMLHRYMNRKPVAIRYAEE